MPSQKKRKGCKVCLLKHPQDFMRHLSFKTKSANETIVKRDWYVVDATNQTLGRMATRIAHVLRGKNKAYYTPHFDCGDYVIVVNCW